MNTFISVVILNYNGEGLLEECIDSVLSSEYSDFEVVVVDNASQDESFVNAQKKFSYDRRINFISNERNLFFCAGNNVGIRAAKGEVVVILNNDTVVDKGWLLPIADAMQDKTIAAAQPKIYKYGSWPLRIDYAGARLDRYGYTSCIGVNEIDKGQFNVNANIFYAGGTAMVLRKKALDEVGLFDEEFAMHWEDVDLSWRMHLRGYRVIYIADSVIYHRGSSTMKKFARNEYVAWHIRKNRIAGLLKNYRLINIVRYLPVTLLIYFLVFLKELIIERKTNLAFSSFFAVIWCVKEMPYILNQRRFIQKEIRRVPDSDILGLLQNKPFLFEFLIRQIRQIV